MTDTTQNPHAHRQKLILGLTRIAALAFGLFIITAVVIANRGESDSWWPFIHHIPYGDKLGHIGLFGALSFLCNLALPGFRVRFLPRFITATSFSLLVLISLEEISHAFLPTRSCDIFDWLADLVGLAIGQITAGILASCSRA
jgi:polysaccharide biosynthesis protein VpsQ